MADLILGVHVTKASHVLDNKASAKDMSDAILRDVSALNINAVQIFTYGPQYLIPNKINYPAVVEATKDLDLTVHSAYMTTGIWKVQPENMDTAGSKSKLDLFKAQMLSCKKVNAWGMVLHVNKEYPDNLTKTMTVLKPIAKKAGIKIILEMVALKADADRTYETPEKIDNLTTMIGPAEQWWGWCVDTAHLWGAGVDLKSYESMKAWLDAITYKKKIVQFHLNGSSAKRGSGKDKHEIAFGPDDLIWNGIVPSKSGVRAIVEYALEHNVTIICEINRGAEENTKKSLKSIIKLAEDYTASKNAMKTTKLVKAPEA
jgi:endonuclease IV